MGGSRGAPELAAVGAACCAKLRSADVAHHGVLCARSSVDRALASGARGRKFESCRARCWNTFAGAGVGVWRLCRLRLEVGRRSAGGGLRGPRPPRGHLLWQPEGARAAQARHQVRRADGATGSTSSPMIHGMSWRSRRSSPTTAARYGRKATASRAPGYLGRRLMPGVIELRVRVSTVSWPAYERSG